MMLNVNDSVLHKSSTGLAAKEKLLKALTAASMPEAQKANARTVIDNIVDKFTFEIQRLQEMVDSYDSRIQKDKKAIKSESETIAEFAREIENKESKMAELLRENKMQKQHYADFKDTADRAKKLWESEKSELIPRLEKELADNRTHVARIEQQVHLIAELEHQNSELRELAETRHRNFAALQEQQRSDRASTVELLRLTTEAEGLRKKLADLEDFIAREEAEYAVKVEQLTAANDNLVKECKGYKKRIKELEEEAWRANMNAGIQENMFDNSFVKESMMKMGQEDLLNRSKINTSVNFSPVHRVNNSTNMPELTLDLVDMDKRSLVIDDRQMKPILRNITMDHDKSLQILENDAMSSDNEINLTLEDIKHKALEPAMRLEFGSQTHNELPEYIRSRPELTLVDVLSHKQYTIPKLVGVEASTQVEQLSSVIEKEVEIVQSKAETSIEDMQMLINHAKRLRQLKVYGYTALILNSNKPVVFEGTTQTDAQTELSFIEHDRVSPSKLVDNSYFDASQGFIENLQMFNKSRDSSPMKRYTAPLLRQLTGPLTLFELPHALKVYNIANAHKQHYGVYYHNAASNETSLSPQNKMGHSLLLSGSKTNVLSVGSVHIIKQASAFKSARKVFDTQQTELYRRQSIATMDTLANNEEVDAGTLGELRAHIVELVNHHEKEISALHDNYNLRIQAMLGQQSERLGSFVIEDVEGYAQSKNDIVKTKVLDVDMHNAIVNQESQRGVLSMEATHVYAKHSNNERDAAMAEYQEFGINTEDMPKDIVSTGIQPSPKNDLEISQPSHVFAKMSNPVRDLAKVDFNDLGVNTEEIHKEHATIGTQQFREINLGISQPSNVLVNHSIPATTQPRPEYCDLAVNTPVITKTQDINQPTTIINQTMQRNTLAISDPSHIFAKQSDLPPFVDHQAQKTKLEESHLMTIEQLKHNHENTINKIKTDLASQMANHELAISKLKSELGGQITIIESEFKKKNAFVESEFNNKLTQLKAEKDQEIEELNRELEEKKAELKNKEASKRQLESQRLEIAQLTTERDSYMAKIGELVHEKEQLELSNHALVLAASSNKSADEYKAKLADQIANNKNILEQLKVLQEAKRKADNRCMDLQTEVDDLERQLAENKAVSVDPFEDFNAEASKIESVMERPRSARDIIQEMQLARSSTLGNLHDARTPIEVSPAKRVNTTASNYLLPMSKSQVSLGSDKKKYRLNLWDKPESSSRDITLPVDNASIHKPVTLRKSEISIGPILANMQAMQQQQNSGRKVAKVKEISNILLQKKANEKEEYVEKAKTYSYDYINIKKCFGILEIIQSYQNLKHINEWFADIVYRLNSWTNKKKKLLVITEQNIFIFNSKTSLKRRIALNELSKLKHSQKNNFVGLSSHAIEEEVLETFRKDEIILFLKKKMKHLNLNLRISEQTNFDKRNRLNDELYYNPNLMKKFKPHYTETFSLAAINHQIGYITTESKEFFGIVDTAREFLCLLTNMGIVCFSRKEFKVSDFIPLVGSRVIVSDRSNMHLRIVLCDATERTLAFHSANDKNAWYDMLNKNIKRLIEMKA